MTTPLASSHVARATVVRLDQLGAQIPRLEDVLDGVRLHLLVRVLRELGEGREVRLRLA